MFVLRRTCRARYLLLLFGFLNEDSETERLTAPFGGCLANPSFADQAKDSNSCFMNTGFIRFLLSLTDASKVELGAKVSLAFTPGGPLVYH